MFKTVALLSAFAAVAVTADNYNQGFRQTNNQPMPGGYVDARVTSENVEMLRIALSSAEHKDYTGNSICIKHVDALQIATLNYEFSVNGCRLAKDQFMGYCQDQVECRRSQFDVKVFTQPWLNTLNVTSITRTQ